MKYFIESNHNNHKQFECDEQLYMIELYELIPCEWKGKKRRLCMLFVTFTNNDVYKTTIDEKTEFCNDRTRMFL